jgi:four helix bundle protein
MNAEDLKKRTKRFALDGIGLFRVLPNEEVARIIGKQMVRCSTSVGANYRSACLAKSKADMVHKLKIVEEESDEAAYWLELLMESNSCPKVDCRPLHREATEIKSIMTASILTLKNGKRDQS